MSGGFVAYHQRPNKAVERLLFIDLLVRLNQYIPISKSTYISFGGPYFEDFKLVHSTFGNKRMISIESDPEVYKRQKFNLPHSCIKLFEMKSDEFINEYEDSNNSIVWLDFATANDRRVQLDEFKALLFKSKIGDIIKVTLNANPNTLFDSNNRKEGGAKYTSDEINHERFKILNEQIGDKVPPDVIYSDMSKKRLPIALLQVIQYVTSDAMLSRGNEQETFLPLTAFSYADSEHQMLTLTGILIHKKNIKKFNEKTQLSKWDCSCLNWQHCLEINIPALSTKEKLFLDGYMPCKNHKKISKKLGFKFAPKDKEHIAVLESYMKFYRYYPSFHRINF